MPKDGCVCVCKGNWRAIVKDYAPLIGSWFVDDNGARHFFFGLVHGDDDYYYGMMREDKTVWLSSCVGGLEASGLVQEPRG